jgi:AcrR family transcriptional regulator
VRTREPPDVRREQLLDAAARVITARGVRATTVAEVAAMAGLAKGTTYLYFASKDELIAALRVRYLDDFARALQADTGDRASAVTRLDAFVAGLFRFAAANHELHHALFHEAGFSETDALSGARSSLEAILRDGIAEGALALDPEEVAPAAAFLLHGIHGALVDTMHGEPAPSLAEAVARATAIAHRTLGVR